MKISILQPSLAMVFIVAVLTLGSGCSQYFSAPRFQHYGKSLAVDCGNRHWKFLLGEPMDIDGLVLDRRRDGDRIYSAFLCVVTNKLAEDLIVQANKHDRNISPEALAIMSKGADAYEQWVKRQFLIVLIFSDDPRMREALHAIDVKDRVRMKGYNTTFVSLSNERGPIPYTVGDILFVTELEHNGRRYKSNVDQSAQSAVTAPDKSAPRADHAPSKSVHPVGYSSPHNYVGMSLAEVKKLHGEPKSLFQINKFIVYKYPGVDIISTNGSTVTSQKNTALSK